MERVGVALFLAVAALCRGAGTNSQITLYFQTAGLGYDPTNGVLYASAVSNTNGFTNCIVSISPLSGSITRVTNLDAPPGDLTVSTEDRALYVAIPSQNSVRRYDLTTRTLGSAFDVGGTVKEMVVMPGQPERLVVIRKEDLSVRVYENGTALPDGFAGDFVNFVSIMCPGADGSHLYGYDLNTTADTFYRMALDSNGVSLVDATMGPFPLPGANMRFGNGLLYSGSGWVGDPEQKTLLGQFALDPSGTDEGLAAPDLVHDMIFLLDYQWPNSTLYACDPQSYHIIGTGVISNTTWSGSIMSDQAYVHDFQRWGEDGFACRTYDKVLITRSSLVPVGPTIDLGVSLSTTNCIVTNQQVFSYKIVCTNLGPVTATNAILNFTFPAEASFVSATNSRGSFGVLSNTVTCTITNLPTLLSDLVQVIVRVQTTNVAALSAFAQLHTPGVDTNQNNNFGVLLTTANWHTYLDESDSVASIVPIDATYSPATGLFYFIFDSSAGALADTLIDFDPSSGAYGLPLYLSGDPQKIVVAADTTNSLEVSMAIPGDVARMDLTSGIVTNEVSQTLWQAIQAKTETIKDQDGLRFTTTAELAMSNNEVLGQFPFCSVFEPDVAVNRLYQLVSSQQLDVFDTETFRPLSNITVPLPPWSYDSMTRWGQQGFLLRATQGFVVWRSSLIPCAAKTDLSAGISFTPAQALTNSPVFLTAVVTNAGQNAATNVALQILLPTKATLLNVSSGSGLVTSNASTITLSLSRLSALASASVTATLRSTNTGILIATAYVSSQSIDTNSLNDSAICSALVTNSSGWPAMNSALTVPLAVNDLVFDPVSDQLFASLGSSLGVCGNSVLVIDPSTGLIRAMWPAGSEPGKLAVSSDGQFLYVSVTGSASVSRFRLADGVQDLSFSMARSFSDKEYASDMAVEPGHPDTVALLRARSGISPSTSDLLMYRNGEQLSNTISAFEIQVIGFNDSGNTLFGYDNEISDFLFSVINVSTNGVSLVKQYGGLLSGYGESFKQQGGLIFGTVGIVFDPIAQMPHGILPGVSRFGGIAPDVTDGRAFGMTVSGTNAVVSVYDLGSMTLLEQEPFQAAIDYPGRFQLCGERRFAYTTQSAIVVLRSSLVPIGPAADLGVHFGSVPDHADINQQFAITLYVTNAGPSAASNCVVGVGFPPGLALVSTSCGGGWFDGNVWYACLPGTMNPGQSQKWTLTLESTNSGLKFLQAYVTADVTDSDSSNDVAACFIPTGLGVVAGSPDQFPLPARSLIYDSGNGKLYAELPAEVGWYGNSIVEIDPATSRVRGPLFVGSEPVALASTDDGHYLYVSLFGLGGMRQVNLDTWTPGPLFPVGAEVQAAVALAGSSNAVVLSHGEDAALYVNGARTSFVSDPTIAELVRGDGSRIYGFNSSLPIMPITSLLTSGNSISKTGEWDGQFFTAGVDLRFAAGHLFSNRGDVLDAESQQVLGRFSGFTQVDAFTPEVDGSKLYTLEDGLLQVWGTTNYQIIAQTNLMMPSTSTEDLLRWGTDGLACLQDNIPIWIRSSFVGTPILSGPLTLSVQMLPSKALQLSFPAKAGSAYWVEFTPTLSPPRWQPVVTNLVGGDNVISLTQSLSGATGFWRLVQENPP
jgi:uncharacterized repeat protein (TIGR01451 family)